MSRHPRRASASTVAQYWPYHTYREHDASRRLALSAVSSAIKRGDLTRQYCERCPKPRRGARAMGHAHHDDYSKPLEVRWLCRKHHAEVHRELAARIPTPEYFQDVRQRENESVLVTVRAGSLVHDVTLLALNELDARNVGMAELGRRLGVSRQRVSLYFNGGIRTLKALAAIAEAIGCEAVVIFRDKAKSEAA